MFLLSLSAGDGHLSTTKMVATKLIAEGQLWEGVQLLLINSPFNVFSMFLLSVSAGGGHLSTTKMVATKLIAEGQLWEGVQLLCLIGKVADACTYLKASKVPAYCICQQIFFLKTLCTTSEYEGHMFVPGGFS
jgi:hypothetical protein